MKKRAADQFWFPFWVDKWIFGSMRIECSLEERAIWVDLLALASKDEGYIRANEETPYPILQLAGMLIVPEDILKKAINKFVRLGKIKREKNKTLYIAKWDKYQFSDRWKREVEKDSSAKTEVPSKKTEPIIDNSTLNNNKLENNIKLRKQIIDYFNETTNQKRSYNCDETNKMINGRLSEGKTLNDFKHVIDTKTTQWLNDTKMRKYLRPSTLFRPGHFEDYLNESYEDPKKKILKVGESTHAPSKKEDDYGKARAIKMKELQEKYQPEYDKANKAQSIDWLDLIDNKIKEEIAEFSREYKEGQ